MSSLAPDSVEALEQRTIDGTCAERRRLLAESPLARSPLAVAASAGTASTRCMSLRLRLAPSVYRLARPRHPPAVDPSSRPGMAARQQGSCSPKRQRLVRNVTRATVAGVERNRGAAATGLVPRYRERRTWRSRHWSSHRSCRVCFEGVFRGLNVVTSRHRTTLEGGQNAWLDRPRSAAA